VLWRHGRTQWNTDGRFQGQLDSPLDPTGLADVAVAAHVLAQLPPTVLLTSSSERATRTAAYLEKEAGVVARSLPELREIRLGAWEGLTGDEARSRFPEEYAAWTRGVDARRGGGETYAEVADRACGVLLSALGEVGRGEVVVVVTHGGTSRAVCGRLLELPSDVWWRLAPLGNARWTVLMEEGRGFRLAEYNAGVTEPADRSRIMAPDVEPTSVEAEDDADEEGLAASADI
jgi:glucosyl-3-phosphoglycerate phosphatase